MAEGKAKYTMPSMPLGGAKGGGQKTMRLTKETLRSMKGMFNSNGGD